jgi:hypothetical protein
MCPGPGHSAADRSLSVTYTTDDIIVHSHAGDDWRLCKDFVRAKLGLVERGHGERVHHAPKVARLSVNGSERSSQAGAIWRGATPIGGTPAELYLASRGLSYTGDTLRWHPHCPFGAERLGCMVALVRNIITNAPQAIHRTAINAAGRNLSHLGANGRRAWVRSAVLGQINRRC